MNNTTCPRCHCDFYTVYLTPEITCPFCGYHFTLIGQPKARKFRRTIIQRECDLIKNDEIFPAQTVDVSEAGLGVRIRERIPVAIKDILHVVVKDFDVDSDAEVVWIKRVDGGISRAGLKFC